MECKNCSKLLESSDNYCNNCGARVIRNRLTARNLWDDFSTQFLNYDNRFLRTFIAMFRDPVSVIDGFIGGVRKKYVTVLSYFAIAVTYAGFYTFINQKFFPEAYQNLFDSVNSSAAQTELSTASYQFIVEYQTFIFFLTIPLLALISRLVFLRNKKYNYAEHLVINLYTYSQASIIITTLGFFAQLDPAIFRVYSFLSLLLQILYFTYVLKKLFQLSLLKIILKTLLFFLIIVVVYILLIVLAVVYMMLFTDLLQKTMEAERLKQTAAYVVSSAMNWTS